VTRRRRQGPRARWWRLHQWRPEAALKQPARPAGSGVRIPEGGPRRLLRARDLGDALLRRAGHPLNMSSVHRSRYPSPQTALLLPQGRGSRSASGSACANTEVARRHWPQPQLRNQSTSGDFLHRKVLAFASAMPRQREARPRRPGEPQRPFAGLLGSDSSGLTDSHLECRRDASGRSANRDQ
jgi:hypothetical protein